MMHMVDYAVMHVMMNMGVHVVVVTPMMTTVVTAMVHHSATRPGAFRRVRDRLHGGGRPAGRRAARAHVAGRRRRGAGVAGWRSGWSRAGVGPPAVGAAAPLSGMAAGGAAAPVSGEAGAGVESWAIAVPPISAVMAQAVTARVESFIFVGPLWVRCDGTLIRPIGSIRK